jgi:hypothetical protein
MFVIAWYVNDKIDREDPFLVDVYPKWGSLDQASRFGNRGAAEALAAWWNEVEPEYGNTRVLSLDEAKEVSQ